MNIKLKEKIPLALLLLALTINVVFAKAFIPVHLLVAGNYSQQYTTTEVGETVQDTIGALFASLAQNIGLLIIVVIGLFAVASFIYIFQKIKGL